MLDRRNFLSLAGAATGAAMLPWSSVRAARPDAPPGLQLWAVQDDLKKDFDGTLKALAKIGYKRAEAAGWYGKTPAEFKASMTGAGIDCVSCHYGLRDLIDGADDKLAFARDVGVTYVVASSPAWKGELPAGKPWVNGVAEAMTLSQWQSNAEAMNTIGAKAKALGLRFGYHNHPAEFLEYDGKLAFHEQLRITDPSLVCFELDIGWVAAAGHDPAHVLHEHGSRIELLHVKDIATKERTPGKIAADLTTVPIGKGTIDWPVVFAAAKHARIHSWFVEQEAPWVQPPLEAMADSIAYLNALPA